MPTLAACYAASRNLTLTATPVDHDKHKSSTAEQRDERLVELAHAAVLVGSPHEVRGLLDRVLATRLRLEGAMSDQKAKLERPAKTTENAAETAPTSELNSQDTAGKSASRSGGAKRRRK
ncbi:MAG: hypothetical protein C0467_22710 [Planctomycetaceae bacterium]|nr:hypothetical protein [Planctomycetaceae bacterium]